MVSKYVDDINPSIRVLESEAVDVKSITELVIFSSSTSVVNTGMLVDVSVGTSVDELTRALDDEGFWHFPVTSESLGAIPLKAGKVRVHSLSSLIFLTPRRESRR